METQVVDGCWLRKFRPLEVFYEIGHQHKMFVSVYHATLNAKRQVCPKEVACALHWLYRKVPCLRLCIREREGEFWFAKMDRENIDFKFDLDGVTVAEMMDSLSNTQLDTFNGPLWRVRYISEEYSDGICVPPGILLEYPYQSQFFFAAHHSITDGTSTLKIIELFVRILNQVMSKTPVDAEPLGIFSDGEFTDVLMAERKQELEGDPARLQQVREEVQKAFQSVTTVWQDAFGIPQCPENKTVHLPSSLDLQTSKRMLQKLRLHDLSINSLMCAIVNVTLVEMLKERLNLDVYSIGALHGVNLRQYWSDVDDIHLGLQIGMMRVFIDTPKNATDDFWTYAKGVHDVLGKKVRTRWSLSEAIVQEMDFKASRDDLQRLFSSDAAPMSLLFAASSLGNVDKAVDSTGDQVQWTALSRIVSAHAIPNLFGVYFQLFRGVLSFSIGYITKYTTEAQARSIIERIKSRLMELSRPDHGHKAKT